MTDLHATVAELVDLLCVGTLDEAAREAAIAEVIAAPEGLDWTDDDATAYAMAIVFNAADLCASGDKVDELHAQIIEMMGDEFAAFPRDIRLPSAYFDWLDAQLAAWGSPGYEAITIDDTQTDNLHVAVVARGTAARARALLEALGISAAQAGDIAWQQRIR